MLKQSEVIQKIKNIVPMFKAKEPEALAHQRSEAFQGLKKHIRKVKAEEPDAPGHLTLDDIDLPSQELVEEELKALEFWRAKTGHDRDQLMGLALSGGGIRSATFSLGVMQAMARQGILEKMDYLSTVSGGGYIGSSLSWLLKEKSGAGVGPEDFPYGTEDPSEPVDRSLLESDQSRLLRYLRQHGKYLTPGNGITLLSGIAVLLRAILLNLLVWVPITVAILFLVQVFSEGLACWITEVCPDTAEAGSPGSATLEAHQKFLFRSALYQAVLLALLFAVACLYYSWRTAAGRGRLSSHRYVIRRRFETVAGAGLAIIAGLVVFGSIPYGVQYSEAASLKLLGEGGKDAAGPAAVALGLASGIWAFFKAGQKAAGKVPLGVLATVGATLLIYGLLIMSYSLADAAEGWYRLGLAVATLAAVLVGWHVNLNYISIHRFYRDRLMESFMPDPQKALRNETGSANRADPARLSEIYDPETPRGPYHIVNTNLVLVDSKTRQRRIRGGDNFILSPFYCGSNATGWRRTDDFSNDGMTLATAMAISGAAANPNTGVGGVGLTRNPLVSILMALLNLRLGYWAVNPHFEKPRRYRPNHFHPGGYEIGGLVNIGGLREDNHFVQLSDGGHFENLAFYELIRRKLRLIIVCDGGADLDATFGDLQTTLRRVEADFGAQVDFDDRNRPSLLVPIKKAGYPKGSTRASQGHIVGDITYADKSKGKLILLKTAMVPGLSVAVKGYKGAHPDFPDETTADQFFDEEQFEAYRELGYHIGKEMIGLLKLKDFIADLERARGGPVVSPI